LDSQSKLFSTIKPINKKTSSLKTHIKKPTIQHNKSNKKKKKKKHKQTNKNQNQNFYKPHLDHHGGLHSRKETFTPKQQPLRLQREIATANQRSFKV